MSQSSAAVDDYDSIVAENDNFFDENFEHETDTGPAENIVRILKSMNVASESEREQIKANLMNSIPGDAVAEDNGNELYVHLLLNFIAFALFGKRMSQSPMS